MNKAATVFQMLIRVTALIQIATGIPLWIKHATGMTPIHMLIGLVLVLCLWALAVIGARARAGGWLVAMAFVWGAITVLLGMTQAQIMPGAGHWMIRVVHILIGLGAIGMAEALGARIKALSRVLRSSLTAA
jgi:hypothetical protein